VSLSARKPHILARAGLFAAGSFVLTVNDGRGGATFHSF
jgi:hypothetical protein